MAVPVLDELFAAVPDIDLRRDAAHALEEIGPAAKAAVPALMAALKDRKGGTRPFAATALGRIGERAEEVVPLLMEMIYEPESYNRYNAVRALGFFGPKARAALPVLREEAEDRRGYIREAISKAVEAIEGGGPAD